MIIVFFKFGKIQFSMIKIIIDSAYLNFYRFHATVRWYNYCEERRRDAENLAWIDNPIFMSTFQKMWFQTIDSICKKFKAKHSDLIFAREGGNCWRYGVYPKYKATRAKCVDPDDLHSPGPVFKKINKDYHPRVKGAKVIRVNSAEGDDIIAVAVDYIKATVPECKIIVISRDHDLLQLSDRCDIYEIASRQKLNCISVENPRRAVLLKILGGDSSDNIPPVFKGCGKVTAAKMADDPQLLAEMIEKKGAQEQYRLNCTLIDFEFIPRSVINEIEAILDDII